MGGRVMVAASACLFASPTSSPYPAQPTEFHPRVGAWAKSPISGLERNRELQIKENL